MESDAAELLAGVEFEAANSSVSLITAAVASARDALTRDNSSSVAFSSLDAYKKKIPKCGVENEDLQDLYFKYIRSRN